MTEEQYKKAQDLQRKIYVKQLSLEGLTYCTNKNISSRKMHISVNGLKQNSIEIDEKHFKTISEILHALTINDLNELKQDFENL